MSDALDSFSEDTARISGWAVDFLRAFHERPKLYRWLVRVLIGKYAYRELCGMANALREAGMMPEYSYELEGQAYHKEKVSLF